MGFDKYNIVNKLNSTQHYDIYEGITKTNNQEVLVKSYKNDILSEEFILCLKNEYDILSNCNNKHIIKSLFIDKSTNEINLIMENFSSEILSQLIKKEKIDLKSFFSISIKICEALEYLHKRDIICCNLSTESILVNKSNEIKFIDLYFSEKVNTDVKEIWEDFDSIYKAPEITNRISTIVTQKVDIYSLGVIFYEILIGKKPFICNDFSLSHNLVAKEFPFASDLNNDIPIIVSKIIQKMTSKNISLRYENISEVLADLHKCFYFLHNKNNQSLKITNIEDIFNINNSYEIVGRSEEFSQLDNYLESVSLKNNILVSLSGNSGIGKTSLIDHFFKKRENKFSKIIKIKLDKYKQNISYEFLYDSIRNLVRQVLSQDEDRLEEFKIKVNESLGSQAKFLIELIPELEVILDKQQEIDSLSEGDAKARLDFLLFKFLKLFNQEKRPLCIFIDDIQWADFITLKWIEKAALNLFNTFFIVSYRKEDVTKQHSVEQMFNKLNSLNVNLKNIYLQPLDKNNISKFIKSNIDLENYKEVSNLIHKKTAGNIFFVKEYLKQLTNCEVIYFDIPSLKWKCNIKKLYSMPISDNVFDVLSNRITTLPQNVLNLLKIASCIGNSFNEDFLQVLYGDNLFFTSLKAAINKDWLIKNNFTLENKYSFSHDRMQQVIYSSLNIYDLQLIHLSIGYKILELNKGLLEKMELINCVNHLNKALSLVIDESKRKKFAELNYKASMYAKLNGDFIGSLKYIKTCMDLEPKCDSNVKEINRLKLRAECEQLNHNNDLAIEFYDKALKLCVNNLQKVNIYELIIKFYTDTSDFKTAYNMGCKAVQLFDVKLPITFNSIKFLLDFKTLQYKLKFIKIEDLLKLPITQDKNVVLLIKILSALLKVAYQINPKLCVWLSIKLINICLSNGLVKESVIGFMVFGVIFQGAILCNHELGDKYSILVTKMLKKFDNKSQLSEVQFVCGYFSNSWNKSLIETEELWYKSYNDGLEIGDWFHSGCSAAAIIQNMFLRGTSFDKILYKIDSFLPVLKSIGVKEQYETILGIKQAIYNLQNKTDSKKSFSDRNFNEDTFVKKLEVFKSKHFAHYYYINKIICLYFQNEFLLAKEFIIKAEKYIDVSRGMYHNTEFYFYKALVLHECITRSTFIKKIKYIKEIKEIKKKFKNWSKLNKENFYARFKILEGKLFELNNNQLAIQSYEDSLEISSMFGQNHLIFISNKGLSKLFENNNQKSIFFLYKNNAQENFNIWISLKKSSKYISSSHIDVDTLLNITLAISKEKNLKMLLKIILQELLQNAGAQNAVLLLESNSNLFVEAHSSISSGFNILNKIPYMHYKNIVHSVINYTSRTKKAIVIDDLKENTIFDDRTSSIKRDVKSILCVPLLFHFELRGIIYLENNIMSSVFKKEKLDLFNYLSGQIAISIENAMIHNELEQKIEKRTKSLDENNEKLKIQNQKLKNQNKEILKLNENIVKENEERKKVELKLQEAVKKLDLLATLDPLTKINNRRSLDDYLINEYKRLRDINEPLSLIMCDVDCFKNYNDYYGHQKGDDCLKLVASILLESVNKKDNLIARYGGEEFVIVLPNTSRKEAVKIAKLVLKNVRSKKITHEKSIVSKYVTVSLGIGISNEIPDFTIHNLIESADKALYDAKMLGRNRVI